MTPRHFVAGVALGDIDLLVCVAGVALVALGFLWWRAWAPLVARDAAALLRFAWQVWRLATSTFVLRGRRSTWRHPPSLCVADVALHDIDLRFALQAWHLAWDLVTSTIILCGMSGNV